MAQPIIKTTADGNCVVTVDWGKEVSFCQTTKVFVAHLLHSQRDKTIPQILHYKGNHLNYVELVGIVVREKIRDNTWYFTIDDGTGLLDCRVNSSVLWNSMKIEPQQSLVSKCIHVIGVAEYSDYSMLGQTVDGNGSLSAVQLIVQTINECADANEEYIHWMDVIQREKWVFPEGGKRKKLPNPSSL